MACAVAIGAVWMASAAQAAQGTAVVQSVRGQADFSQGDGAWKVLRVGKVLTQGAIIRTGVESQVDLFLDQNGPVVRLKENTQLGIDRLTFEDTSVETVIETRLDLKSGRILGKVDRMAAASLYEVETPNGVAGIRGTEYDISADGTVRVNTGEVVYNYRFNGQMFQHIVNAGESFDPTTNTLAPTPPNIVNQIVSEFIVINEVPQTLAPRPTRRPVPDAEPPSQDNTDQLDPDPTDKDPYGTNRPGV